jgi:hypothetical protein
MIRTYLASGGGIVITDHCYSRFAEKTKLITISISPVPGYDLKQMADWFGIDNPRAGGVLEDKISEMHLDLDQPFGLQLEQGYSLYDCPLGAPVIWGEGADQFVVRIAGHPVANAGVYGVSFPSVRGGEYLFAFTHTYGPGRVYYQGDIVGSPNYPWVIELFGGGLNWAAGRI